MSSRCLFAALALLGCLAGPGRAEAQLPATGLSLTAEGVDTEFPGNPIYINVAACKDKPTTLKFKATLQATGGGSQQVQVVEVWGGAGKGSNCHLAESRKGDNNTQSKCWLVWRSSSVITTGIEFGADISANVAFDNGRDMKCDEGVTGSIYELYFVPLETQTTPGTGDAPAPLTDVEELLATFTLYTALPAAPGGVSGRNGEDEIGASWNTVNAGPTTRYTVYFDTGSGGGGGGGDAGASLECGSGKLVQGETPPPVDDMTIFSVSSNSTSGSLGNLGAKGIELGDQVAVAVATVDIADNRSTLSAPVCVERVETTGFWDACESSDSCKDDFETCSVTPGKTPRGMFMALVLAIGALALGRRRKASRERNV